MDGGGADLSKGKLYVDVSGLGCEFQSRTCSPANKFAVA